MSFQRMTDDVEIISKLSDEPNETDGLTAAQLKAKFDEAAKLLKTAHNNLVDAMNAVTAAANIGFESENISGETVKAALENLRSDLVTQMQGITQGSVADGSITTVKLGTNAVTLPKIDLNSVGLQDVTQSMTVEASEDLQQAFSNVHSQFFFSPVTGLVFFIVDAYAETDSRGKFYSEMKVGGSYLPREAVAAAAYFQGSSATSQIYIPSHSQDAVIEVTIDGIANSSSTVRISGWYRREEVI